MGLVSRGRKISRAESNNGPLARFRNDANASAIGKCGISAASKLTLGIKTQLYYQRQFGYRNVTCRRSPVQGQRTSWGAVDSEAGSLNWYEPQSSTADTQPVAPGDARLTSTLYSFIPRRNMPPDSPPHRLAYPVSYKYSSSWRWISSESALQCPPRGPNLLLNSTKKRPFCTNRSTMEMHHQRKLRFLLPRSPSCSWYSSLSHSHLSQLDHT